MNFKESFKKVLAFTLAETLIVIGIIGVVAALTIPNLNSSTADREKVAKVKKVYAQLNEAFERAQAVYGPIEEWPFGDYDHEYGSFDDTMQQNSVLVVNRLSEFLKYQKIILPKDNDDAKYSNPYMIYLPDGSTIGVTEVWPEEADLSTQYENLTWYGEIWIDIDGPNKGKNLPGYDIFDFDITNNGILPNSTQYFFEITGSCGTTDGVVCFTSDEIYATAWVIQNGNMDYLKTSDGKTCNDSDIVLDWTTNTSCK